MDVFLAYAPGVRENILGVFFSFFLDFWELQGTDAAAGARMQRRGHMERAHYRPARRTYVRPSVAGGEAAAAKPLGGRVWGGPCPPQYEFSLISTGGRADSK